jgi:protein phosphatase
LYKLEIENSKLKSKWKKINCSALRPSRRYGHTMYFVNNQLFVFGGITKEKNRILNDLWILNLENKIQKVIKNIPKIIKITDEFNLTINENREHIFEWKQIQFFEKPMPSPRMYHSSGICKSGRAKGMIMFFGGRGENGNPLNDLWGLRKHKDGEWEWVAAPYSKKQIPLKRYQHCAVFYSNYMVILGGLSDLDKIDSVGGMPVEIFDCDKLEWCTNFTFNVFRGSSFVLDRYAFIYGGCNYDSPLDPTEKIVMFDIQDLCSNIQQ